MESKEQYIARAPLSIQQEREVYFREDGSTFTREDIFVKLAVTFRDNMLAKLKGPKLSVFLCIALHCGEDMESWPSLSTIERETGYTRKAVVGAIKELETLGLLSVDRAERPQLTHTSNRYSIKSFFSMGNKEASILSTPGLVDSVHQASILSTPEEETMKKKPEKKAAASAAVPDKLTLDNYAEMGYNVSGPIKVVHYPEDEEFTCPNPMCAEQVVWATLNKRKATCPHCGQYLEGYEFGDSRPTWKPPRIAKQRQVLGNIIDGCPEKFADIMYYKRDEKAVLFFLEAHRDVFLDCLNWATGKMAQGQMPENKVVENAIKWMQKRLKASPEPEKQEPPRQVRGREEVKVSTTLPSGVHPWHEE